MHASSRGKKRALPSATNTQQDLFDHSVIEHTGVARLLCIRRAPKARCMMIEEKKVRKTYPQEWPAYNQAQTNEKARFLELLYGLCAGIQEPVQTFGRPRLPFAEMLFCCVYKVYSSFSSRRFISDLQIARERGYVSKVPHFNSVSNYMEMESLTPYLHELIKESALPLKMVECDFAIDSSGFATNARQNWVDAKWSKTRGMYGAPKRMINRLDWLKAHIMCGVKTNIITAVEITDAHGGDSPQFGPLVEATSKNFLMNEVSADKAYSSSKNLQLVLVKGAQPYIPFRSSTTGKSANATSVWKHMFGLYQNNRDWFMQHYHKRSNVESCFSMIKAKFGQRLRSKTSTAQKNELLCKILAHNICCLIQSIYELGVEPDFWATLQ